MQSLPEIVFASSDPVISRQVGVLVREGRLRKLLPRVYTSNFTESDEALVRRNLFRLIAQLFPDSQLAFKTGLTFAPDTGGNVFLHGRSRRPVRWPGVSLYFTAALPTLSDDNPLYGSLRAPSLARALLENLSGVKALKGLSRTVDPATLEIRLIQTLDTAGRPGLNTLRDRARAVAKILNLSAAFARLDNLISALMTTRPSSSLTTEAGLRHSLGRPYDAVRVELFALLATELRRSSLPTEGIGSDLREDPYRVISFYEAYFSNFIEGTEFAVEEARRIVYDGEDIPLQTEDSHDVRSLYELCSDKGLMEIDLAAPAETLKWLRARHAAFMKHRLAKRPGIFKTTANRAGDTEFVQPSYVLGTLEQGLKYISGFDEPLHKAIFLMFVISEVHPFDDGNGRIARLATNAVLSRVGLPKLIVPTVYREDYLLGLRGLTRRRDAAGYIRMMYRIWRYSAAIPSQSLTAAQTYFEETRAFRESSEAVIVFPEGV